MLGRLRRLAVVRRVVRAVGVARVVTAVGVARRPLLGVVGLLVSRVPRDPRRVALGAPLDRFADNAAYLFLHLQGGDLQPVWITGSREVQRRLTGLGYDAHLRWSAAGLRATLRAGTFVYSAYRSDINTWLAPGARTVCLWHGLPIKRVERGVVPAGRRRSPLRDRLDGWGREQPPDVLLSSTPEISRQFMSPAFGVPPDRCWDLGYPRNDHLTAAPGAEPPAALLPDPTTWHRLHDQPLVVGLFLTWRDSRATDVADTDLVTALGEVCSRHGATLAYKAHMNVAATQVDAAHVVTIPPDDDLSAYLGLCDVLVTDYSSVALDFLLLGRPTLYYTPDIEQYARQRGFYLDPRSLPGICTPDRAELLAALGRLLEDGPGTGGAEVEQARRMVWGDDAGGAAERIAARLSAESGARAAAR